VFCPTCGAAVADEGAFCSGCGARVDATGGAASPAKSAAEPVAVAEPAAAPIYAPPPAAQPVYAPPPGTYAPPPGVAPAVQPKKKRGCLIALGIVGGLTACCIAVPALAFFGVLSLGKPRDLGVRYTEKDYQSATAKLGIDVSQADPGASAATDGSTSGDPGTGTTVDPGTGTTVDPGTGTTGGTTKPTTPPKTTKTTKHSAPVTQGPAKGTMVVYEGSRPIDIYLTSEEFSALMSMHHYSPNWLVQDLQVRFGDDGQLELSGYVVWEGRMYGGYASAVGELTGPQSVGGSITKLEGMGVEVPGEYYGPAGDYLAGVMNDWLSQMDGLNLTEATVTGGQLHLVGTVPGRVVRVPADTP
jgi:hypothetical protein